MTGYGAGMTALVAIFFAVPALRIVPTFLVGALTAAAIGYGVAASRPRHGYSWLLLAAAVLIYAAGDTVYLVADLSADPSDSVAAVSDVLYLVMVPFFGAGLLGLTRPDSGTEERTGLLDFLIFSTAVAFLLWVFVLGPLLAAPGVGSFEYSVLATYVLAGGMLLIITLRLVVTTRVSPAATLLAIGAAGALTSDLVYASGVLSGTWQHGGLAEVGWFVFYGAWGAAALHPSMVRLTAQPEPPPPAAPFPHLPRGGEQRAGTEVSRGRLALLGLAALLAPAVLLVQGLTGEVRDGAVIGVVSGLMFALVFSRLADVADGHRNAVARERGLREAGAALVSARDADEVRRALRTAVARLVPDRSSYRIVFTVNQADGVPAVATSIWGPAVATPPPFYSAPTAAAARRARMLRVRTLHPALADQLRDFESVLLCPLVLDEHTAGVPRVGALLVATDSKVLPTLRDSLEVLAGQAALALGRIGLGQEINRRESEAYFRSLVQNAADVILILGPDHRIRYASPAVTSVLGVEPTACTDLGAVVHPDDRESALALLARLDSAPEPGELVESGEWVEWSVRRPDGDWVYLEVSCRDLRRDRAVRGLVVTMRDVTERQRLEQELTHRSLRDPLTGLANRACFHDQVHGAVEAARERGRTAGTLSIDLDEFTAVNDTHGHANGDALLAATGHRLAELVGAAGTVARLGGDEFAVLVPDADSSEEIEAIADHLVGALAEPLAVGGTVVSGSVSIGVATTADATDAGELLQRADLALYVAKGAGKGRWCRYQASLHTAIVERLELRTALAEAVEKNGFSVEYQPIVRMDSGAAAGFEALVRWHHPARGPVPPDQFIALAEETGLIEPIGDWVLRQAVAAAGRWYRERADGGAPYVSINVSARQLRTAGFVTRVRAALAEAEVPPTLVMLEITESLLLRDEEPVWSKLAELRALGVRVAIDDFGTGFSSLSYLQQMPADVLKIDRSFTATIASSRRQRLLVEGIIRLADTLGLDIIAEGVETEPARTLLMDMGCLIGQGYLFSRSLTEAEMARWLGNERKITTNG